MKKLIALFFSLALVFGFSTNATFAANLGNDGVDKDCDDFTSQKEAQKYFEGDGGSKSNNVDRLDRNRNGIACEDYKYSGGSDDKGDSDTDNNDSGNNNSGNDKSDDNSSSKDSSKDSSQGGQLPKTATNYPISMLAGALLLLTGVGMLTLKARRGL